MKLTSYQSMNTNTKVLDKVISERSDLEYKRMIKFVTITADKVSQKHHSRVVEVKL